MYVKNTLLKSDVSVQELALETRDSLAGARAQKNSIRRRLKLVMKYNHIDSEVRQGMYQDLTLMYVSATGP